MEQTAPYFPGVLKSRDAELPVRARYASRYSLWLEYGDGTAEELTGDFPLLTLEVDSKSVEMGPCRVWQERNGSGGAFRLVPLGSIPNFEKLFFRSRIDTLESSAVNLPLILGYKNSINTAFREYVSDLTYDLSAYKTLFDRIDSEYREEDPAVRDSIQAGILENLGPDLMGYLDAQLSRLYQIVRDFTDKEHEHHGYYFRKQLWNIILCSPIMARTNLKPRGYIGDSEMMRMIYLDDYQGESTFGKIMHKHPVGQPAAQAVRNRRRDLAAMVTRFMDAPANAALSRVNVLSVACGPAFELADILRTSRDCERLHYSLLDQDQQALLEAAGLVAEIEERLHTRLSVDFIKESVRTMLVTRELQERWGEFHFIYSMGLFDYLTPPVAVAVLKKLYNLLLPGGELVIGNFSTHNPTLYYMAYWLDWSILHRTEEELVALAAELPGATTSVEYDETGIQMFLRIQKRGSNG